MSDDNKTIPNDKNQIQYHNLVVLTNETAEQLYNYLRTEYISYEQFPKLIELLKVLSNKFHPDLKHG